eukprot:jgi/Undpi1/523/HiC_scaffold_10.g03987.m1
MVHTGPQAPGDETTKLGNTVWPGQTAVDPSSGFSLVHDREGAVNSPACKPKLEGQGQQGFEGPEKTLEIEFDPDVGHENGLRAIRREQWDAILKQAQCHIMHHRGNEWFDSYVLSESSLFVYKSKVVLKTCGTTALLRSVARLESLHVARAFSNFTSYGLSLEWIGYSRKEFQFPTDQVLPSCNATAIPACKVRFRSRRPTTSLNAYVHGPLNGDRWYTYVADDGKRPTIITADRTLNIMMYGLEPEVAQNFFKSEKVQTADDASLRSGIRRVIPKAILQDHLFDPCGYSMNALEGRGYYTVHVTPESDFSYASFETNVRLPDYDDMVRGVLDVFRPKKFTMTLFADKSGIENIKQNPFDNCDISCGRTSASSQAARYHRTIKTTTNFSGDYLSQMGNWVRAPPEALQPAALQAA